MAKNKYWDGTSWQEVGASANKVTLIDNGNLITATDVEGALQEVGTKLAETTQQGTSLVKLLQAYSSLNEKVLVKVIDTSTVELGIFYGKNKVCTYNMKKDGDGWFRLFDVVTKTVTKAEVVEDFRKSVNYNAITGTWVTTSEPTYYTTEVGATFTGVFDGTGFNFNSRTDNRGGIWEILVDGYITKTISVWSEVLTENVQIPIVRGLPDSIHTVVGTFKGDDPLNAPTGGTARGWANHYVEGGGASIFRTITPSYISYTVSATGLSVLQAASRKEFAFSVIPDGTAYPYQWIPEHSVLGCLKDLSASIKFDDKVVGVDSIWSEISENYRLCKNVRFQSDFNAYHPSDQVSPLWSGRLDQTINPSGFHIKGKMIFLRDTKIAVGYPIMLAVSKAGMGNDQVITSHGVRYQLPIDINDDSDILLDNKPFSIAHFTSNSLVQGEKDVVIALEIADYKNTMRVGLPNAPSSIATRLRTDGERKTYGMSCLTHTAVVGEKFNFGCTYFVGEIANAAKILA